VAGGRPGGTAAAGAGGSDATYAGQLIALIRPRIVFAVPENTPSSVYAEFQVDLLPTGEILAVRRLKASGLPGYDEAVERAIRRTDPFPRKRDGTVERTVIIRFRPVDAQ
jgi:colicin import membrane protein